MASSWKYNILISSIVSLCIMCHMLFNAKPSPNFAPSRSWNTFKPSPLNIRKMHQLLRILFHWHLDHRLSGFPSILVFLNMVPQKIQMHFEEFSSVNVHTTITPKQDPIQQSRHPNVFCTLPDQIHRAGDSTKWEQDKPCTDQAIFPKKKKNCYVL